MPQYESLFRPQRQNATLVATSDITHDIREFRCRSEATSHFLSGQYALLHLPGIPGDRAYSMANTSNDDREWHFQIRRVPGGEATGYLFSQLRVGDRIELDGPYGMAYLREDSRRDIVCIAGGSGLSPMVSITRAAAVAPIDFVFGGRTAQDICGKEMLQMLPDLGQIFTTIQLFPACLKPMMAGMVTEAMCMKWRTVFSPHGFLRARSILQVPPQWDKQYRKCWSTSASTQPKCILTSSIDHLAATDSR